MELSLFLAQTAPSKVELAATALLPTLVGLGVFFVLNKQEPGQILYRLRLLSLLPIIGGLIYGGILSYRVATDYLYQQLNLIGLGTTLLHYATLAIPLLGLAAVLVWNAKASRSEKYDF